MILVFIFLILRVGNIPSAISSPQANFEQDYYEEIENSGFLLQNILCDSSTMNIYRQIAVCHDIFRKFLYRSIWNVHLNKLKFAKLYLSSEPCTERKITWKKMVVERDWSPLLLTCYGQHRPIRTSNTQDDYFESFFLTSGSSAMQLYLFKRTITATAQEIVLLAKYTVDIDPRNAWLTISGKELQEEEVYLNTIETRNFDIVEIEMIYAKDIMQQTERFDHQLYHLDRARLITVCFSVFHDVGDLYHGAIIDIDEMFKADQVTKSQLVTLQSEIDLPHNEQSLYSCRAKYADGRKMHTMVVKELFYMSPGRRPNSIFAYRQTGAPNFVKLIFYVENFDFIKLKPTRPSETGTRRFQYPTI